MYGRADESSFLEEEDEQLERRTTELPVMQIRESPEIDSFTEDDFVTRRGNPTVVVFLAASLSAIGGVLFGYDVGIISGALLQIKKEFDLNCTQQEFVVATMLAGAILASLMGGCIVDYVGRRTTIMLNAVVFIVGAAILTTSINFSMLLAGRIVVGFGVALSVIAECVYISEISPPKRRGMLVSLNELGIVIGFLLAYLVSYAFIETHNGWRLMFGFSALPALIQGVGMFFLPPSPRFLILKGKDNQARSVLAQLLGPGMVDHELDNISAAIHAEKQESTCSLFSSRENMLRRMGIGCGLVFLQQITGQPNVLYYAPIIFQSLGFHTDSAATLATVGLGSAKMLFAMIVLLLLDKAGRRKFLISGTLLMAVCLLILGGVSFLYPNTEFTNPCIDSYTDSATQPSGQSPPGQSSMSGQSLMLQNADADELRMNSSTSAPKMSDIGFHLLNGNISSEAQQMEHGNMYDSKNGVMDNEGSNTTFTNMTSHDLTIKCIAVISLVGYIAGFEISFGLGTWLVLSEIFPSSVRGRAIALATILNWATNLLVSMTFLDLMNSVGIVWLFIAYGIISIFGAAFLFFFVPETKGKTLEQISEDLRKGPLMQADLCRKRSNVYRRIQLDSEPVFDSY